MSALSAYRRAIDVALNWCIVWFFKTTNTAPNKGPKRFIPLMLTVNTSLRKQAQRGNVVLLQGGAKPQSWKRPLMTSGRLQKRPQSWLKRLLVIKVTANAKSVYTHAFIGNRSFDYNDCSQVNIHVKTIKHESNACKQEEERKKNGWISPLMKAMLTNNR